jgi:hypothetical protein
VTRLNSLQATRTRRYIPAAAPRAQARRPVKTDCLLANSCLSHLLMGITDAAGAEVWSRFRLC